MVPVDSECYRECPEQKKLTKEVQKNSCYGRVLVIIIKLAQFLTDWSRNGTNRFRILPQDQDKKFWKGRDGRDLVITVKLAQFLTDRAQSGTTRFRILPGMSRKKNVEKGVMGVV